MFDVKAAKENADQVKSAIYLVLVPLKGLQSDVWGAF